MNVLLNIQYLYLVIIIASIAFAIYLAWYNSAKQKGKRGEMRVFSILMQLPDEYTIFNDVILSTSTGTTQIDHIVVSKYGVFAIETKNYRGEIYGDDYRKEWTQLIVTKVTYPKKWWKTYTYVTKNHFYNPVKQSQGHAYRIKELIKSFPYLKIVPIVVFAGDAILKNVVSKYHVVYEEELLSAINEYKTIYLTDDEVHKVVNILETNNVRDIVNNRQHVKNIRAAEKKIDAIVGSGICPKCGGTLVERFGQYGVFYGCSNFPQCNFTKNY